MCHASSARVILFTGRYKFGGRLWLRVPLPVHFNPSRHGDAPPRVIPSLARLPRKSGSLQAAQCAFVPALARHKPPGIPAQSLGPPLHPDGRSCPTHPANHSFAFPSRVLLRERAFCATAARGLFPFGCSSPLLQNAVPLYRTSSTGSQSGLSWAHVTLIPSTRSLSRLSRLVCLAHPSFDPSTLSTRNTHFHCF